MDNDAAKLLTSEFVNLHDDLKTFWSEQRTHNAAVLQLFCEVNAKLTRLSTRLGAFQDQTQEEIEHVMASLDEVLNDVADESTRIDSLGTLIDGIKKQLDDALAGANLPPAVQAKVDGIFAAIEQNKTKVQAAIDRNTTPEPPPPPPPGDGGGEPPPPTAKMR